LAWFSENAFQNARLLSQQPASVGVGEFELDGDDDCAVDFVSLGKLFVLNPVRSQHHHRALASN
jgi:hypothetical protein